MQVNEAHQPYPDAEFKLDDVELSHITFVGQIRNIAKQTTNMTYKLDDGTGTVEVKQWPDSPTHNDYGDPLPDQEEPLKNGDWVRVWGKMKAFNNKRHVGAVAIRPIRDKNEINYHLLEATYVHLYFTRGPPGQQNAAAAHGQPQGYADQTDHYGAAAVQRLPNLSMNAKKVLQCLKTQPQNNEGLHTQHIAALTGMELSDVMNAGDELLGQSCIFTTVDDNTWAILE
jgi:replication factor A2